MVLAVSRQHIGPSGPVKPPHPTELGQHGVLLRPKLVHRVLLLLGRLLLLLLWDHHPSVVLVEVARVWGARLSLRGDVVGGGLGLHAGGRAGVRGLRLGPRGGLWRADLVTEGARAQSLTLEMGMWRLGHLLLGAHRVAVLGRRAPS